MSDCLFCKMVSGEITPDTVYEDDDVLAFRDISPQAPTHVLVIPRQHVSTLNDLDADSAGLVGKMVLPGLPGRKAFRNRVIAPSSTAMRTVVRLSFISTCICWVGGS